MIQNLSVKYNMKGLVPNESFLYLPYPKRTVSMIYFDAREVFASLLSCPTINQDKDFFSHERDGAPFSEPLRTSDLGDIDNGRCYRRTHKALVRNPGFDMILPCIAGMDKTHIDLVECMQMEPLFCQWPSYSCCTIPTKCNPHSGIYRSQHPCTQA